MITQGGCKCMTLSSSAQAFRKIFKNILTVSPLSTPFATFVASSHCKKGLQGTARQAVP